MSNTTVHDGTQTVWLNTIPFKELSLGILLYYSSS